MCAELRSSASSKYVNMMTTLQETVAETITRSRILSQSADLNEHENVYLNQIFSLQTQSSSINQAAKNKSSFKIQ